MRDGRHVDDRRRRRAAARVLRVTTVVTGIGRLVTNTERGELPGRVAWSIDGDARRRRSAPGRRRPPTSGSTSPGAASSPASSTATPTSCSPATAPPSSRPGWPARPTRPAGSTPRSPPPAPRPTTSCGRRGRGPSAEARRAGITTIEVKSGYGATVDDEARLRPPGRRADARGDVPRRPRRARPASTPTPTSSSSATEMLAAAAPHARWIDAFCEVGAFDADQCRAVLTAGRDAGLGHAPARQPARTGARRPARGRARLRLGRPLHVPHRRRRRGARRQRHRRHVPAGDRLLDPPAVPRRPPRDRCRRHRRAGHQLQPGVELHDVDVVRHRPRRARPAHDGRGGAAGGDARRRASRCNATMSAGSARAPAPTSSSSTPLVTSTSCTGRASR